MRIATLALFLASSLALVACASSRAAGSGDAPADPVPSAIAPPPEPDRSCRVDADCTVKNVGNCCGYYPACVNVSAETFPEQVKAACEREGRMAICGFPEIQSCRCVAQRCEPASTGGNEVM